MAKTPKKMQSGGDLTSTKKPVIKPNYDSKKPKSPLSAYLKNRKKPEKIGPRPDFIKKAEINNINSFKNKKFDKSEKPSEIKPNKNLKKPPYIRKKPMIYK